MVVRGDVCDRGEQGRRLTWGLHALACRVVPQYIFCIHNTPEIFDIVTPIHSPNDLKAVVRLEVVSYPV